MQSGYEVFKKRLDTSRKPVKSLGRVGDQQDSCEISRKSLDTSRIAVKALEKVWTPEGYL